MTSILYILCPNSQILEATRLKYNRFAWARPLLLPPLSNELPIFENAAYKIIESLRDEWEKADHVGTLSWKFESKISLKALEHDLTNKKLFDFVPFFVNRDRSAVNSGISNHGDDFGRAWSALKEKAGYTADNNEVIETCSNFWMCTPRLMTRYIEWHTALLKFATEERNDLFAANAFYPAGSLTGEKMKLIWGKTYYPMLPFVFERFSAMFFANYENVYFENFLVVSSSLKKIAFLCIGGREDDFIDVKHNVLPFVHHESMMLYVPASKPELEMTCIQKYFKAYKEILYSNDLFFLFTGSIRVSCVFKKVLNVINSPNIPYSDLYYVGFSPLSSDRSMWTYKGLQSFECPSSPETEAIKLNNVVYGGGIAFRKSFYKELEQCDHLEWGTLSEFLWNRKKNTVGIFPQFVLPDSNNCDEMLKFCNPRFYNIRYYMKSNSWNGWRP